VAFGEGDEQRRVGEVVAEGDSAQIEAEAETSGEAKWAAMKELERSYPGIDVEQVEFEVDESAEGGACVTARADLAAWRLSQAQFEWPEEPAERVRELLRRVTAHLGLRASVDVEEDADALRATISGSELGLLIGKHGQTIDALQFLCGQAAYRGRADRKRVLLDAGGYRERREAALRRAADRGVADALRYGRPIELDSMPASERRIVHQYLQERGEVETHSEGDEPYRRIVITPPGSRS
jgi:spoIIIJ-associated protein